MLATVLPFEAAPNVRMEAADSLSFLGSVDSDSIKLVVSSPPYHIGKQYGKFRDYHIGANGERAIFSDLKRYLAEQAKTISECVRVLHPQGSICWQVGNHIAKDGEVVPLDVLLYPLFKQHGLTLRNRIIWHFEHGLHCASRFSGRYETVLWFTKGDDYTFHLDPVRVPSKYPSKKYFKGPKSGQLSCNPLGKNPGDVWIIPNVKFNHVEKTAHPCQFPVELVERLVLSMTNRGDNVIDPYMGVGSSVVAAMKHGRFGMGCDIEKRYVEIAWDRVRAQSVGTLRTRPMGKPVYDPTKPRGGHV